MDERDRETRKIRLPRNIIEIQNREEGLQKTIDSTNKGFEMLKKMGYKEGNIYDNIRKCLSGFFSRLWGRDLAQPHTIRICQSEIFIVLGDSLGKSNTGRVEPIPIEIKTSRSGLGREEAVKKVLETKSKLRQKHLEEQCAKRKSQQEVSAQEFRCNP